jgi:hypothetical protein
METPVYKLELLKHQIALEESNYRYAAQSHKDSDMLRRMREHIRVLKEELELMEAMRPNQKQPKDIPNL